MPADPASEACFGANEVRALQSGELHPERREKLLRHAALCEPCRKQLAEAGLGKTNANTLGAIAGANTGGFQTAAAPSASTPSATHRTPNREHDSPADSPAPIESPASHGRSTPVHLAPTVDAPSSPAAGRDDRMYPFLDPPERQGELGRLGGYRILRVLGQGGMGIVFEASDDLLGRRVAIKVLRQEETDESHTRRFLQEARLAASLPHDRIVTIHQVGQQPCPYIVMELLEGETLDDRLTREGRLPLAETLRISREVAEGLEVAHAKRLVHRDIKPANVFLENAQGGPTGGRVKVLDFGVARPIVSSENLTMQGRVVGTPGYMSPEQACGFSADGRSDLFALGCLMYAMLDGATPFDRTSDIATLHAVVRDEPPSIREKHPDVPAAVAKLVDSLLAKSPLDRPADARSVVEAIELIERQAGPAPAGRQNSPRSHMRMAWSRKKKFGWSAASGVATIALALLVGLWYQWHDFKSTVAGSSADPTGVPGEPVVLAPAEGGAASGTPANPTPAASVPGASTFAGPSSTGPTAAAPKPGLPPIKIGILLSLSGVMRASERPLLDAMLLAVEEINAAGGLLGGRAVEPLWRDGQSRDAKFAAEAQDLVEHEQVVTLFGCWRSPSRKMVEAVCRAHDNLLVFPLTYEGLEESPYVIYMGGAPNQQLLPAAKFAYAHLGKRKFFLVGAEGIYSHASHEILRDELTSLGGEVVGDEHVSLGSTHFMPVAERIKATGADCVMCTVSGSGNFALFHCLDAAGITMPQVAVISFRLTEDDLRGLAQEHIVGAYAAWSYFQSGSIEANQQFIRRFRDRYGPDRVVNDPMEAAYNGVRLWAEAVTAARSDKTPEIRRAFVAQRREAPEGLVTLSASNRHAARLALIGQVDESLEFDVVWNSPKPIPPEPFPSSRTRAQWEAWLEQFESRKFPAESADDPNPRESLAP